MFKLIGKEKIANLHEKLLNSIDGIGSLTWLSFDSVLIRTLRLGLHVQNNLTSESVLCI